MNLKRLCRLFIVINLIYFNWYCSNFNEQIIGDYTIEEYENLKTGEYNYPYQILSLNKDHVFILRKVLTDEKISGIWNILEKRDSIITIEFVVNGKKVVGNLSSNHLNFEYPNDLYDDKFLRLRYLKLDDRIDKTKSNPFTAAIEECNCFNSRRDSNIQQHVKYCDSLMGSRHHYYRIYIENEELLYNWDSRRMYDNKFLNYDSIDVVFNKKGISKSVRDSAFWFGQKVYDISITECELK